MVLTVCTYSHIFDKMVLTVCTYSHIFDKMVLTVCVYIYMPIMYTHIHMYLQTEKNLCAIFKKKM